ncbi:MAG: DUF4159 domain-containing protein [Planctomycetaceae bacterium]
MPPSRWPQWRTFALVVPAILSIAVGDRPLLAQQDDQLRTQAIAAMKRGQQFLLGQQSDTGAWAQEGHDIGTTSLVLMSLIYSGMTTSDPAVARAIEFLRSAETPDNTYDVSLMAMALALTDEQRSLGKLRRLARWLIDAQHGGGHPAPGTWGYKKGDGWWDNSNTQFAILGLREAAQAGVDVPPQVWKLSQQHFLKFKHGREGVGNGVQWYYGENDSDPRGSMQVAGIASLMITESMLDEDKNVSPNGDIDCCGAFDDEIYRNVESGFTWLGQPGIFTVKANPAKGPTWHLYYLYGLERAGRFTGRRFLGSGDDLFDWYRMGVRHLLTLQNPQQGSWFDPSSQSHPTIGTALALLFLSKGNAPILVNKLKYGDERNELFGRGWNRHPRDAANLTDFLATQDRWPKLMSWQVADLAIAAREQDGAALLQAKVQLLTGDGPLDAISDAEVELLRDYINQGGFLFAVNTCGGPAFDEAFRQLVQRMFPTGEFSLQKLPDTHDVYRSEFAFLSVDGASVPELWGVDIGCRTAIMYAPFDHACRWNKWMRNDPPDRMLAVKTQIRRSMELATNVIAYATGRELLDALTEPERLVAETDIVRRGKLEIARLRHNGGWDTAPNALRHLQRALQTVGVQALPEAPNLAATDPDLFDHPLLYMHGRKNFRLTEAERASLTTYLEQGGFLMADACCGAPQFDESFRQLIRELFNRELTPIPLEHELFQSSLTHDIREVRRRLPIEGRPGTPLQTDFTTGPPVLEGITDDQGRYIVVYSKYDLSCALERQATVNCAGYSDVDAAKIATNIVVYALTQ